MARDKKFKRKVFEVVHTIPRGEVLSYGEVARRAGNPRAARAVGVILSRNYDPKIPCHRVIRSDKSLGGYNRGASRKRMFLEKEGFLGR